MSTFDDEGDEVVQTTSFLAKNLVISEKMDADGEKVDPLFLGGKILSEVFFGPRRVKDVFNGVWRCKKPWNVKEIKPGLLQFRFEDCGDLMKVMGGRPWTIKGYQLLLKRWPANLTEEELDFSVSPFWVRMGGLPPGFLNIGSARELAPMLGTFLGFSGRPGNDLKMRVDVNVEKALFSGFFLDRDNLPPLWIYCKYENLGRVCFKCGRLGHEEESCAKRKWVLVMASHSPEVKMFGSWIHEESPIKSAYAGFEKLIGKGK